MIRPHFRVVHDGATDRVVCNVCETEVIPYPARLPNATRISQAKSAHECPPPKGKAA